MKNPGMTTSRIRVEEAKLYMTNQTGKCFTSPVKYFLLAYFLASKKYNSERKPKREPQEQVEQTGELV